MASLMVQVNGEEIRIGLEHAYLVQKPKHLSDEEWESWGMSDSVPVKIDYDGESRTFTAWCVAYGNKFGVSWSQPGDLDWFYEGMIRNQKLQDLADRITEEERQGIENLNAAIGAILAR